MKKAASGLIIFFLFMNAMVANTPGGTGYQGGGILSVDGLTG